MNMADGDTFGHEQKNEGNSFVTDASSFTRTQNTPDPLPLMKGRPPSRLPVSPLISAACTWIIRYSGDQRLLTWDHCATSSSPDWLTPSRTTVSRPAHLHADWSDADKHDAEFDRLILRRGSFKGGPETMAVAAAARARQNGGRSADGTAGDVWGWWHRCQGYSDGITKRFQKRRNDKSPHFPCWNLEGRSCSKFIKAKRLLQWVWEAQIKEEYKYPHTLNDTYHRHTGGWGFISVIYMYKQVSARLHPWNCLWVSHIHNITLWSKHKDAVCSRPSFMCPQKHLFHKR